MKQQSHLPGMPFPKELPRYPSRADVVAYLEAYAAHFGIVPRTNEAVRAVRAADGGFVVESARAVHRARAVVLAAGLNRVPNPERLPEQERFRGARPPFFATIATATRSPGSACWSWGPAIRGRRSRSTSRSAARGRRWRCARR